MDPGIVLDNDRLDRSPPRTDPSVAWKLLATFIMLSATISIMYWGWETSAGLRRLHELAGRLESHLDSQDRDMAALRDRMEELKGALERR